MRIHYKDFHVRPVEKSDLKQPPTIVQPFIAR